MQFGSWVTVFCVIGMISTGCCTISQSVSADTDPATPLIIAHRGASIRAPENTLAAFREAVELGFDLIELDVHRTSDGEIVVIHDETLDRTTTGKGRVRELTLEQIRPHDAGSKFGAQFTGERVPTLKEVLDWAPEHVTLCIELKVSGIAEEVVRMVESAGRVDRTIIFAFDGSNGPIVKRANPEIPFLWLTEAPADKRIERIPNMISTALKSHANFIGIEQSAFSLELLNEARRRGLRLWVWTVNNPAQIKRFADMGVDGIITDCPDIAREVIGSERRGKE